MKELHTTSEVIEKLGGNHAVAALTGSKPKAVSMWKTAGNFPWHSRERIAEALRAIGLTAPVSLWGMKSPADRETAP